MRYDKNDKLKLNNKKRVGIVLKPNFDDVEQLDRVLDILKKFGVKFEFEKNSALNIQKEGIDFKQLCKNVDFMISIGGDGTLISTARKSFLDEVAILGINFGTLGFLTSINPTNLDSFFNDFFNDIYKIDQRMMIEANIRLKKSYAFNDIVIKSKSVAHMVKVKAYIDNKEFNSYYGDGVIISTPTGSTAYNLSSNGPIVYPLTEAFILTPISAHSLTQRAIVLPANFEISFKIDSPDGAIVIADGQDIYELKNNDIISIKEANKKVCLIRPSNRDYFKVLNEKLGWGKKL